MAEGEALKIDPRDPKYDDEIVIPIGKRAFDRIVDKLRHPVLVVPVGSILTREELPEDDPVSEIDRLRDYGRAISFEEFGFRLIRKR